MKLLKCIVQPNKLNEVRNALASISVNGMTVSEVQGFGRQNGSGGSKGTNDPVEGLVRLMEIEVVVPDRLARRTMDTMLQTARSGRPGDGKIFILDVDQAVRIRTGESDDAAL